MKKTLTIAIPAYNMEKYLSRCLDSVFSSAHLTDLEVIVINDGSKDNTLCIAQQYALRFPESLNVIDKSNGGWGSAINIAMKKATGKYFKILDSDDWFCTQALNDFILLLKSIDSDLVASSYSKEYDDQTSKNFIYSDHISNKKISFVEFLKSNNYTRKTPMATITYRTDILQKEQITIADRFYADIEYHLIPLIYIKSIFFTQINLYKYYIGRDGQSTSIAGYNSHINDYIEVSKRLTSFYNKNRSSMKEEIRIMYLKDNANVLRFVYYLLLSPTFSGNKKESLSQLKELDIFIKEQSKQLYNLCGKFCIRKIIPYIYIWRKTSLNVFKLKF